MRYGGTAGDDTTPLFPPSPRPGMPRRGDPSMAFSYRLTLSLTLSVTFPIRNPLARLCAEHGQPRRYDPSRGRREHGCASDLAHRADRADSRGGAPRARRRREPEGLSSEGGVATSVARSSRAPGRTPAGASSPSRRRASKNARQVVRARSPASLPQSTEGRLTQYAPTPPWSSSPAPPRCASSTGRTSGQLMR